MRNLMLTLTLLISGCSSWPDSGTGGGDQLHVIAEPTYLSAIKHKRHAALLAQTEVLDAQTQLLIIQGAERCIPAAVAQLQQQGLRVRRQLGGSLFTDASTDLVAYQHMIRQVQWRFDSIKKQTQCSVPAPVQNLNQLPVTAAVQNIALFTVLFDTDSAEIGPGYLRHLELVAQLLKHCQCELILVGHTDQQGDEQSNQILSMLRVDAVESILQRLGINNIKRLASGEQEPLLRQSADQQINRRVDLLVRPLEHTSMVTAESDPVLLLRQWNDAGVAVK